MPTPKTNYLVNGKDLSDIFYPLSPDVSGQTTPTGITYNDGTGPKDLITLFASYFAGTTTADTTNYTSSAFGGRDLNTIFQNINVPPSLYTTTHTNSIATKYVNIYNGDSYTGVVFELTGYVSSNASITFNIDVTNATVIIVGGGGGGAGNSGGGGGGGGTTILNSITFNNGTRYNIVIGSGGVNTALSGASGSQSNIRIGTTNYRSYGGNGAISNTGQTTITDGAGGAGGGINSLYGGGGGGGGASGLPGPSNNGFCSGGVGGSNRSE